MTGRKRMYRIRPPAVAAISLLFVFLFAGLSPAEEAVSLGSFNDVMVSRLADVPEDAAISFIFCADLHVPFDDKGVVSNLVKKANELRPTFIMIGGDMVQTGDPANYASLKRVLRKFRIPVVAAIGNHDTAFSDYSDQVEWTARFGETFFFFDIGPARFIALNSAIAELPDEQLSFLETALDTDKMKFIFMHRPVNYLNPLYDTPIKKGSDRFRELVEAAGVTAVMTGHEHHYGHYEVGGVQYIVSGGAGGWLNDYTKNNFHHFILGRIEDGEFDYKVVKLLGEAVDDN